MLKVETTMVREPTTTVNCIDNDVEKLKSSCLYSLPSLLNYKGS